MDSEHDPSSDAPVVAAVTEQDIRDIYRQMRPEDWREAVAVAGTAGNARLLLEQSVFHSASRARAARQGGRLICVWGIVPSFDVVGVGRPWMLATPEIKKVSIAFLRASRVVVDIWQEDFPILTNVVDARNDLHLRWLDWLGFRRVATLEGYGARQETFYQFIRTAPCASLSQA